MFENLLYQNVSELLKNDILNNRLPGAILLSGPEKSGKLTCALEIARILSCNGENGVRGAWNCTCSSCRKTKELSDQNMLLAGPKSCSLEIMAAKRTFLQAAYNNESYLAATRYLFIRSVRKLTLRFSQVLWEDDDKISKISPLTLSIAEQLEKISPEKSLPENDELQKICDTVSEDCLKLETSFMYSSLPVSQIRKASVWARMKSVSGKKVFIIENAERMLESVRNALLKILEEPPADVVFILTTSNRGAVMPTILSRVRTYHFSERSLAQQKEVIERVFHENCDKPDFTIEKLLQNYLPVSPADIYKTAGDYFENLMKGQIVLASSIYEKCMSFEPEKIFKLFLEGILKASAAAGKTPQKVEACQKIAEFVRECYNSVQIYNQNPKAAIEKLTKDLSSVRKIYNS